MKIISIINQKGGVGKTTTASNLGDYLSKKFKVLLLDVDKQGNLSSNFNVEPEGDCNIYNVFLNKKVVVKPIAITKNLHIIPSNDDMAGADLTIQNELSRELILKRFLDTLNGNYDYVIIDCPPDINLVTINALSASTGIIIPVNMDYFGFKGIGVMIDFILNLKGAINPTLNVHGILITNFDDRLEVSKDVLHEFAKYEYDDLLFKSKIRKNTDITKAQLAKQTVLKYKPNSNGAQDYTAFGKEFLKITK